MIQLMHGGNILLKVVVKDIMWMTVKIGTVHHEATGHNEQKWVQDSAAWTETVTTGYKCSGCGATK